MPGLDFDQRYVRLLTQHQAALRAFIVTLMPGSPDVGDVLQETNLALWNKRERYAEGTNFHAWAHAVARLEVLRQRRRTRRTGTFALSDEVLEKLARESPPPQTDEAYLRALEGCMAKLDDEHREMISWRYSAGKSLQALAERRGETPGALRISLMRIRRALRQCVEQQIAGGLP